MPLLDMDYGVYGKSQVNFSNMENSTYQRKITNGECFSLLHFL